ncbi:MAG: FkbM family methyltransferase [Candidatus Shapirobacteria bacterium]|jgi:FkbM family methyltransferase
MIPRIKSLYYIIKTTQNWIEVLLVRYGKQESCNIIFRNGYRFDLVKKNWQEYIFHAYLFAILPSAKLTSDSVSFNYQNQPLNFRFGKYGFSTIFEIFAFDPYRDFLKNVNPKGKVVVDIGAAFGDTAIYFLMKGASRVVAVEAFPGYFKLAEQNIRNNNFSDKCDLVLSAVAGEPGNLEIDPNAEDMFGTNFKKSENGQVVPVTTLSEIVDKFGIQDGFLKVDTEGYEYEIILKTPKDQLRRFSDMLIEYHYGSEKLEKYLKECGFSLFKTGPTHVYVPHLVGEEAKNMYTGHIVAKRLD